MAYVEFPLTSDEISTFSSLLNKLDFEYFEPALEKEEINPADYEKIAVVKAWLEQFNDVIARRIAWYESTLGIELPDGVEALEKYE